MQGQVMASVWGQNKQRKEEGFYFRRTPREDLFGEVAFWQSAEWVWMSAI